MGAVHDTWKFQAGMNRLSFIDILVSEHGGGRWKLTHSAYPRCRPRVHPPRSQWPI
jgi:hypothetical protein